MNKILFILLSFAISQLSMAQDAPFFEIDFEGGYVHAPNDSAIWHLTIDTASNPNNIWQIGIPQKTVFDSAYSVPNAIITDTMNSYPINNSSSFTVEYILNGVDNIMSLLMHGQYFVDSDTLVDTGTIEFSPDNGLSWINLLENTTYADDIQVNGSVLSDTNANIPVLSGSSNGWRPIGINIHHLGMTLNLQSGDTTLWRFSFHSDGIDSGRDGLMYDNLYFENAPPIGINEQSIHAESICFPNPAESEITIGLTENTVETDLIIYDALGTVVYHSASMKNHTIDVSEYPAGLFTYIIRNKEGKLESDGSFVKR